MFWCNTYSFDLLQYASSLLRVVIVVVSSFTKAVITYFLMLDLLYTFRRVRTYIHPQHHRAHLQKW